ncbi:17120_t:CDS:1, partial [Funneliformis geosporum]
NSPNDIGKVYVSKESGGLETSFELLRNNSFDKNGKIGIIPISPLTKERKQYLYSNIRKHVDEPFKEVHFSKPDEH